MVLRLTGSRWARYCLPSVSTIFGSSSGLGLGVTLSVRSKVSSPHCTDSRVWSEAVMQSPEPMHFLRNRLRVISIDFARLISSSRVSSGISPIWVRYMRTGSSIRSGATTRSSTAAAGSVVVRGWLTLAAEPAAVAASAAPSSASASSTTSIP